MFECLGENYFKAKDIRMRKYVVELFDIKSGSRAAEELVRKIFDANHPCRINLNELQAKICEKLGYDEQRTGKKKLEFTLAWLSSIVIRCILLADEISCLRRGHQVL